MQSRRAATTAVLVAASAAAPAFRGIHREYVEPLPGFPGPIPSSVPLIGRREAHSHPVPAWGRRKPPELCGFRRAMRSDPSAFQRLVQRIISRCPYAAPPSISSYARTQLSVQLPTSLPDADADGLHRRGRSLSQHRCSTRLAPPIAGGRGTGPGTRGESPLPRAGALRGAIPRRVVPTAAVPVESNRPHTLHGQCTGRVGQRVDLAILDSSVLRRKVSTRWTARVLVVRRGPAGRS